MTTPIDPLDLATREWCKAKDMLRHARNRVTRGSGPLNGQMASTLLKRAEERYERACDDRARIREARTDDSS